MKKLYYIIILLIICGVIILIANLGDGQKETENNANTNNETTNEEIQKIIINEIKEETGLSADNNLYEVNTEYDGRKVLNIKTDIQYKVAFAGIIKKQKPQMDELDNMLNSNHPIKNGIWVDKNSSEGILKLLSSSANSIYRIDEDGYLTLEEKGQQNENDKIIEKAISSDKKIILTINSLYYEVDNITGEIVEYPFEKLDNYQAFDEIKSDNNSIIVITTNSENKLTNKEIIEEILQNIMEELV